MAAKRTIKPRRRSWRRALPRACAWLLLAGPVLSVVLVLPFAWLPPPVSSFMLQARWQDGPDAARVAYQWVPLAEISPHMALAAVAAEDQRFPDHGGFDLVSIRQALADYRRGEPLRGASTISQQVAKNLYLWPGRSLLRKGLEAWFTVLIEALWSKQRILEVYLNIAQLGDGVFGVEAASRRFFAKPAQALTREEAALLAAVLPGPGIYRVEAPSPRVRWRQDWILRQMRQLGGLDYLAKL